MRRVRLVEAKICEEPMILVTTFVQAANAQGFDLDWVEAVLTEALANNCVNFWNIIINYIEIIPDRPTS